MLLLAIRIASIDGPSALASSSSKIRPIGQIGLRDVPNWRYKTAPARCRPRPLSRSLSTTPSRKQHVSTPQAESSSLAQCHVRQQEAAKSLRPILHELPDDIDVAVAYGSGVMKQANPTGPPPMIDLLLSTPSAEAFHTSNLQLNPTHYPSHARVFGSRWVSRVQSWGAGAWYIPQVTLAGKSIKYGVVSTSTLLSDLNHWNTFYFAGRFQKPTVTLQIAKSVEDDLRDATQKNDTAALALALCLIPESTFSEIELWEKIAGLSYAGDPRMGLGAENPDKVKNIVRGPGAIEGFRAKYGPLLQQMNIAFADGSFTNLEHWTGDHEAVLKRPDRPSFLADTVSKLPAAMTSRTELSYDQMQMRAKLLQTLRQISGPPALRQSIKGLLTAGLGKSITYGLAKLKKGSAGRKS